MNKKILKIAAIGVSHWHAIYDSAYLQRLKNIEGAKLIAIQDENEEILTQRLNVLGGEIKGYYSYEDMIDAEIPDFVIVLSRHDLMTKIGNYLLDKKIPYMMEKPMSFSAYELENVLSRYKVGLDFAAVPFNNRYSDFARIAKGFVDSKEYGEITNFYFRLNRPTSQRYRNWGSGWMLDPVYSNGGCLRNLGNHGIDMFAYLLGRSNHINVIGSQLNWDTLNEQVEDYATVLLKSNKGQTATIEVGNTYPFDGTDGEFKIGFKNALLTEKDNVITLHTSTGKRILPNSSLDITTECLKDILKSVSNSLNPPIDILDCYTSVRIIDEAYIKAGNPYGSASVK